MPFAMLNTEYVGVPLNGYSRRTRPSDHASPEPMFWNLKGMPKSHPSVWPFFLAFRTVDFKEPRMNANQHSVYSRELAAIRGSQ